MATSYEVISLHRQAAIADPVAAADYRLVLDNRARTFAAFVHDLKADLAPGMDETTATDILSCFSNEEIYRELVQERHWTDDRYERWLAATLIAQLITAPADGASTTTALPTP